MTPVGGTMVYRPYGAALDLFLCQAEQCIITGAAGTGKSRAALTKLYYGCYRYPGLRVLVSRKVRASMTETTLQVLVDLVAPHDPVLHPRGRRGSHGSYVFPNKSEIVVAGLDQTNKVMGGSFDWIFVDECTEVTAKEWDDLRTRLGRDQNRRVAPYVQLMGACNPQGPSHWIYQRWLKQGRNGFVMLQARHADNPAVGAAYLNTLRSLTGAQRARLYEGRWVANEGVVYSDWSPALIVPHFDAPPSWNRIAGIDWGLHNPTAVQWWVEQPTTGLWYLEREFYHTDVGAEDVAALLRRYPVQYVFSDHDAQARKVLTRRGVPTMRAKKDVLLGIQHVQQLMSSRNAVGQGRIRIMAGALIQRDLHLAEQGRPTCLADELAVYSWATPGTHGIARDQPAKANDHACDAMRYALFSFHQLRHA